MAARINTAFSSTAATAKHQFLVDRQKRPHCDVCCFSKKLFRALTLSAITTSTMAACGTLQLVLNFELNRPLMVGP